MIIGKWLRSIFSPPGASLLYEVTPRCNLKCDHCYNVWKGRQPYSTSELPRQAALDVVEKVMRESRCVNFTFTGGEPTLRPDLEDLVRLARSRCRHVNLITNGTLLNEARITSLLDAGVSLFELTLNSADRRTHNRMAGGIDCFDRVTRAAAEIRAQGGDLAVVFVATSANIDDWEETLQLGVALGAQGFLFNRYNAGGASHETPECLMPSIEQVRHALTVSERYASEYGVAISASVPIPPCLIDPQEFPHVGMGYCPLGTARAYWTVDPLGNIRPCNHSSIILGNAREHSFRRIKRSARLAAFAAAQPSFCSACKMKRACMSGCRAAAQACYDTPHVCEPFIDLHREEARQPV